MSLSLRIVWAEKFFSISMCFLIQSFQSFCQLIPWVYLEPSQVLPVNYFREKINIPFNISIFSHFFELISGIFCITFLSHSFVLLLCQFYHNFQINFNCDSFYIVSAELSFYQTKGDWFRIDAKENKFYIQSLLQT